MRKTRPMSDSAPYTIDNIKDYIGKEIGVTDWFEIDQSRIDTFADVTEDHNPLHVDPKIAASGPFGKTIAHGFLTLSMLSKFAYDNNLAPAGVEFGINYGFERIRFMTPVKVGDRIRNRQKLLGASDKGQGRFVVRTRNNIEIENERNPALVADWLCMFIREGAAEAAE